MKAISAQTGKPIDALQHLRQSVRDILMTPKGSRVMRRDYGSTLFELIDKPMNDSLMMQIFAATVEALRKWEPRFRISRVNTSSATMNGKLEITLTGDVLDWTSPDKTSSVELSFPLGIRGVS